MAGKSGFGTLFKRETATPGTYADLGEMVDVVPPGARRDVVDTTTHKSTGGWRTFTGSLKDGGEASVTILFEPGGTAHDDLIADMASDDPKNYRIDPAGSGDFCTFAALVTDLSPATPLNDKMVLTARFKVSGQPTWSAS